jgi:hypothetical protein
MHDLFGVGMDWNVLKPYPDDRFGLYVARCLFELLKIFATVFGGVDFCRVNV